MPRDITRGTLFGHAFQVLSECNGSKGWRALFEFVGIYFSVRERFAVAPMLVQEISAEKMNVLRSLPGFEDLPQNCVRGIERGDPARSLLYFMLASPGVRKQNFTPEELAKNPSLKLLSEIKGYPDLAELEILENFVYVATRHENLKTVKNPVSAPSLEELVAYGKSLGNRFKNGNELGVVVFSQQFRRGDGSVHKKHADICFSRTGVSRVGTEATEYISAIRGFSPLAKGDSSNTIRALPAQYGAYLAVLLSPNSSSNTFGPLGFGDVTEGQGDSSNQFWVPVHKLFSGKECLRKDSGLLDLTVEYSAFHVNEKIYRFHQFLAANSIDAGHMAEALAGKLTTPPYVITQGIAKLAGPTDHSLSNGLLIPTAQPLASKTETTFKIPNIGGPVGKFVSTLLVSSDRNNGARSAPEYMHIRDDVRNGDLNNDPNMQNILFRQQREAYHYSDGTADGWVTVKISGLDRLTVFPAYSLVTAPDFYPMVNQYDLQLWTKRKQQRGNEWWWDTEPREPIYVQGGPDALSQERYLANMTLIKDGKKVFGQKDGGNTVTAIVTLPGERGNLVGIRNTSKSFGFDPKQGEITLPQHLIHQSLPDAAAGVFAPGWDITMDFTDGETHYAAYGLGSPFPEDSKLCAALSAFWPAAGPDATREFMRDRLDGPKDRTIVPMTNLEIGGSLPGYDPGEVLPWDGIQGPRLEQSGGKWNLIYPSFYFADYTFSAAGGMFSIARTYAVSMEEYLLRMHVMHSARGYIMQHEHKFGVLNQDCWLLSFEKNEDNQFYLHFGKVSLVKGNVGNYQGPGAHRFFSTPVREPFTLLIDQNLNITENVGIVPAPNPS